MHQVTHGTPIDPPSPPPIPALTPTPAITGETPLVARNLPALLMEQAHKRPDATAALVEQGGRVAALSWAALARRVQDLADGFAALGVQRGDRVGLIADTSVDAAVADLAASAAGAVVVPLYITSTPRECEVALGHSGANWVLCDGEIQAEKIRAVRARLPALRGVVRLDGHVHDVFECDVRDVVQGAQAWRATHGGVGAHEERVVALRPADPRCIVYTSASTGSPRGVVLTHGAFLYAASAIARSGLIGTNDVALFFLPLAHVFARLCIETWLHVGYTLAFTTLEHAAEAATALRPTVVPATPVFYEKLFAALTSRALAAGGLRGRLFRRALQQLERAAARRAQGQRTQPCATLALARKLVFPDLAEELSRRLGGRLRLLVSGSAPLSPAIGAFFEELGLEVVEGYGVTESAGVVSVNPPRRARLGTAGPALPGTEVRLAGDGELLVRGPGLMLGYWRDHAATAAAMPDGWLRTGDVGAIDASGYLRISDRKRDIITTATGKQIAPQQLEAALEADPLVSHALVHGDRRRHLVALLTLDEERVRIWAALEGLTLAARPHSDPRVRARMQRAVDALNAEVPRFSTIRRFAILAHDFTVEAGELTPTHQVRRRRCDERYAHVIEALYDEENWRPSAGEWA